MHSNLKDWCTDNSRNDILEQWDYEKNAPLLPTECSPASHKKVWWKCQKGHSWSAIISNRYKGSGCPICAGKQVLHGFNDLETLAPELAKEWHPTKNTNVTPATITLGSGKKVWWIDALGHEWIASVGERAKGKGCPFCSGRKILVGFNDLNTTFPELAAEWDQKKKRFLSYSSNQRIDPSRMVEMSIRA